MIACEISALATFRDARRLGDRTLLDAPSIHHAAQDRLHGTTDPPRLHRRIVALKDAEIALADHILTVSELARQTYLEAGVPPEKVHAVPLGADLELFSPDGLRKDGKECIFLFSGAAIHRKGFDLLLAAFDRARAEAPAVRLRLVGSRGDSAHLLDRRGTESGDRRPGSDPSAGAGGGAPAGRRPGAPLAQRLVRDGGRRGARLRPPRPGLGDGRREGSGRSRGRMAGSCRWRTSRRWRRGWPGAPGTSTPSAPCGPDCRRAAESATWPAYHQRLADWGAAGGAAVKLLHVVPTYLPAWRHGGPILAIHGLCKALVARGHQVTVFTTDVHGEGKLDVPLARPVEIDGVEVRYFPVCLAPPPLYFAPGLAAAVREEAARFDAVHLHSVFLWPTSAAARAAERAGVPYLLSPRGMLVPELIRARGRWRKLAWMLLAERRTIERAAALHATSALEAAEAARLGLASAARSSWCRTGSIPQPWNGDLAALSPAVRKAVSRASLPALPRPPLLEKGARPADPRARRRPRRRPRGRRQRRGGDPPGSWSGSPASSGVAAASASWARSTARTRRRSSTARRRSCSLPARRTSATWSSKPGRRGGRSPSLPRWGWRRRSARPAPGSSPPGISERPCATCSATRRARRHGPARGGGGPRALRLGGGGGGRWRRSTRRIAR